MHRLIPTLSLLCAGLVAQDHVVTLGHSSQSGNNGQSYPAFRVKDQDFDGIASVPGELMPFLSRCWTTRQYSATEPYPKCFYTDVRFAVENGELAFYFSESEEGRIVRGVDSNHDGILQDSEVTEFFFFPIVNNGNAVRFSPDAVAVHRDPVTNQTRVYVGMDDPTALRGIWRLVDLNGDGDAMDAGEYAPFVNASMGLTVPGNAGPVAISRDDWENLRVLPNGNVIGFQNGSNVNQDPVTGQYLPPANGQDAFAWFGFVDNNGTASPYLFFNPSALNALPQFVDFQNGTFPTFDQQTAPTVRANNVRFVDVVAAAGPAGQDVYYITMKRQQNRGGDVNINGVVVSGLVYRALDNNGNGAVDPGELSLWCNITPAAVGTVQPVTFTNLANGAVINQFGSDTYAVSAASDRSFSFVYDNASQKAVVTLRDADFSGVIDQGEANMVYYSPQGPSGFGFPFNATFGPFVMGMVSLPNGLLPGPFGPGVQTIGDGCIAPGRGLRPVMDTWYGSPAVGNTAFQAGVIRSLPFVANFLLASFVPAPNPLNLGLLGLPAGCFGYLQNPTTVGFALSDPQGRARFPVGIPNNANLQGVSLLMQTATYDATNTGVIPFYTSNAIQLTVQ